MERRLLGALQKWEPCEEHALQRLGHLSTHSQLRDVPGEATRVRARILQECMPGGGHVADRHLGASRTGALESARGGPVRAVHEARHHSVRRARVREVGGGEGPTPGAFAHRLDKLAREARLPSPPVSLCAILPRLHMWAGASKQVTQRVDITRPRKWAFDDVGGIRAHLCEDAGEGKAVEGLGFRVQHPNPLTLVGEAGRTHELLECLVGAHAVKARTA
mmetsp:Transcript_5104/g.15085  ORF Transcript_5104/g.15085 Transcript_5104/m.15085 type:complete len:220 (+) Transcript_5104:381-1040(+)